MICPNPKCKKQNPDDNVFCEYCGTRLDASSTPTVYEIKIEKPEKNVTARTWKCSLCGVENTADMNSCVKCGNHRIQKPVKDPSNKLDRFQEKSGDPGKIFAKIITIYLYIAIGVAVVVGIIGFLCEL